jgi:hypothetical protein
MRKQHPQCDLLVLLYQLSVLLQHLDVFQFRNQLLNLVSIVQMQLSLLDQLHNSDACDHLRARCNPEDIVERHVFGTIDSPLARRVGEEFLAILIDHHYASSWNIRFGISARIVHRLLQILNNILR